MDCSASKITILNKNHIKVLSSETSEYDPHTCYLYYVFVEPLVRGHAISADFIKKFIKEKVPYYLYHIIGIDNIHKFRVRINFNNSQFANLFKNELSLQAEYGYRFIIPKSKLIRWALVNGWDLGKSCEQFFMMYSSQYTILEILRHYDNNLPTDTLKICFRGQICPTYIRVEGIHYKVVPYVEKVEMCYKCLQYGHYFKVCKNNTKCPKCYGPHQLLDCKKHTKKCFYCNGNHLTSDINICPEKFRQIEIKYIMTIQNCSFIEAWNIVAKTNKPQFRGMLDWTKKIAHFR